MRAAQIERETMNVRAVVATEGATHSGNCLPTVVERVIQDSCRGLLTYSRTIRSWACWSGSPLVK